MESGTLLLGRFRVDSQVATGGMGAVYRAHDVEANRTVAVKVLRTAEEPAEVERFRREAALLARMSHEGIVRYIDSGTTADGTPFLVEEWVEGQTMAEVLFERGLTTRESVDVLRRVATAMAAVHRHGVVHRDIKPENLLFVGGELERVKVIDFGIAMDPERGLSRLTRTGAMVGTPGYMSPEQARGLREVDARADVFALGCVLYECLTGRSAFAGQNLMAVRTKVIFSEPPPPRAFEPSIPAELDALVMRMLDKLRDARPADAGAVVAELSLLGELPDDQRRRLRPFDPATRIEIGRRGAGGVDTASPTSPRGSGLVCMVLAEEQVADDQARLPTLTPDVIERRERALRDAVAVYGAHLEFTEDGAVAITLTGASSPQEQAARAARCALAVRALMPSASIVLTSGAGEARGALDDVIDRGVRALELAALGLVGDAGAAPIAIDEVTAALLDTDFEVSRRAPGRYMLRGERATTASD